jgi:hypothetical protein
VNRHNEHVGGPIEYEDTNVRQINLRSDRTPFSVQPAKLGRLRIRVRVPPAESPLRQDAAPAHPPGARARRLGM